MCGPYQRPRRALVRNQSPVTRLPAVVEVDPSQWGRPNLLAWRYSLRTQSAALFLVTWLR